MSQIDRDRLEDLGLIDGTPAGDDPQERSAPAATGALQQINSHR